MLVQAITVVVQSSRQQPCYRSRVYLVLVIRLTFRCRVELLRELFLLSYLVNSFTIYGTGFCAQYLLAVVRLFKVQFGTVVLRELRAHVHKVQCLRHVHGEQRFAQALLRIVHRIISKS
eukprot:5596478-Amphidinium_carterae.1